MRSLTHSGDTSKATATAPLPSSSSNPPLEPRSSPSQTPDETSTFRPLRKRPAIPTLTVPPAPPPKRVLNAQIQEAKLRRRPSQTRLSIQSPNSLNHIPPTSPFPSASSSESEVSTAPSDITKLPYFVQRVHPSGQLPIYTDFKGHRTLKLTRVRKISGDVHRLRREIKEYLGIEQDKDCAVNAVTGHIVVKGHWKGELDTFFVSKGF